jgi:hypothetical protein
MTKRVVAFVLAAGLSGFGFAQLTGRLTEVTKAPPGSMTKLAEQIANDFDWRRQGAGSAAQVSQVADEASVALQYAIVKQNDEIIRLLKKLANEK